MTDEGSSVQERKQALEALEKIGILIRGYTLAIAHLSGDESKGVYYSEFYNQARSKDGIIKP